MHSSLRCHQGARLDGIDSWVLFRTAGHQVRTQFGVSPSDPGRQKRGDVEIVSYLQDAAGARNLVFDLRITHDRYGKSAQPHHNGQLTHPHDLDAPLRIAAQSKINEYRQQSEH